MVVGGRGLRFGDPWGGFAVARGGLGAVQAFEGLLSVVDEALDGDVGVEPGAGAGEVGEGEEGTCATEGRAGCRSIVSEGGHGSVGGGPGMGNRDGRAHFIIRASRARPSSAVPGIRFAVSRLPPSRPIPSPRDHPFSALLLSPLSAIPSSPTTPLHRSNPETAVRRQRPP